MSSLSDRRADDYFANDATGEAATSAISWGAILGGAAAAAAMSLILLILGSALGLASASPWNYAGGAGDAVASFTMHTAIWLIIMQWMSSGLGGYLTGRLRVKWSGLHSDEVFFRDTAHGFLAWCVATLLTASVLASASSAVISGGVRAVSTVASGAAMGTAAQTDTTSGNSDGYYIDSLFRTQAPNPAAPTADATAEAGRIMIMAAKNGVLPESDKTYLAQVIAARTGVNEADANKRIDDVMAQMNAAKETIKQEAEAARKTAMHVAIYLFLSMLIGAFIASAAAAIGGRHRVEY